MTKPILYWVGGKTKIAPQIMQHFPKDFHQWIEPFFGGGGMWCAVGCPRNSIIADGNENLMNFYKGLFSYSKNDLERLVALEQVQDIKESKKLFESAKNRLNDKTAAIFDMYICNKLGFNGLYRENKSRKYNVSFGQRNMPKLDVENLQKFANKLQSVKMLSKWQSCLLYAKEHDVVYCDPPYHGTFT